MKKNNNGDSVWDKLVMSTADALNPLNVLWTILKFIFFGMMIGAGYLIMNLDMVFNNTHSTLFDYLKALGSALWSGIFIGLSTVWDTFLKIVSGEIGRSYATIGISVIILLFAVFTFHQPIRILFNVFDLKKGRSTPVIITLFVAFIITLFIITPFSNFNLHGQTITSHLDNEGNFVGDVIGGNSSVPINSSVVNESVGVDDFVINLYEQVGG